MSNNEETVIRTPPARRDPYRLIGETFDGRYRLDEFAGAGSFGAVYHALDTRLHRTVAVKVLKPDIKEDSAATARELFQREALTSGRLVHPHIVAVTDTGEEQGFAYLVMEWLQGHTLEDELRTRAPLSVHETAQLLAPITDALSAAHDAGVVHRDIKPSNIHLGREGRTHVKVLDFGIAKVVSSASAASDASRIAGTLSYMSPEQISGGRIDRRTDIYSLGVLLHQMLGGQLPFTGGTQGQLIHQHIVEPPPPLHSIRPEISPALSQVVQRALAKQPEERQQTAQQLYAEFAAALGNSSTHTAYQAPSETTFQSPSASYPSSTSPSSAPPIQANQSGIGGTTSSQFSSAPSLENAPTEFAPTIVAAPVGLNPASANVAAASPAIAPTIMATSVRATTPRASEKLGTTIGFAVGGAILLFILSLVVGFVPRWLGWSQMPNQYDDFVLSLLPLAVRDSVFGTMFGASLSELWGRPAPRWAVANYRWVRTLITHGAAGAAILMLPFVVLRTSSLLYPMALAFIGFMLGMLVCGARFFVQKVVSVQKRS